MIHLIDCVVPNANERFLRQCVYPKIPGYRLPQGPMELPLWAAKLMSLQLPMQYRCVHDAPSMFPVFSREKLSDDTYVFAVSQDNVSLVDACLRECADIGCNVIVGGDKAAAGKLSSIAVFADTLEQAGMMLTARKLDRALAPDWLRLQRGTVMRLRVDGGCPWGRCVFCTGIPPHSKRVLDLDDIRAQARRLAKSAPPYVYWDAKMFPWDEASLRAMKAAFLQLVSPTSVLGEQFQGFVVQTNPAWVAKPGPHFSAWRGLVRVVELGIEAFSEAALAFLQKPHAHMSDVDYTHALYRITHDIQAHMLPYVLLGVPGQDPSVVVEELGDMQRMFGDRMPGVQLNWLSAYAGTQLEAWCQERFGVVTDDDRAQNTSHKTWLTPTQRAEWESAERQVRALFGWKDGD